MIGDGDSSLEVEDRCPEIRPIDGELIADEVEQLAARARHDQAATHANPAARRCEKEIR